MDWHVILLTLHLLGVGILVGVVFVSLYFVTKAQSVDQLRSFIALRRIGSLGTAVAIAAGIALAWQWASFLLQSPLFLTKLGLVLADGLIAQFGFLPALKGALARNDTNGIKAKLLPWAIVSVAIIIAIVAISVFRAESYS